MSQENCFNCIVCANEFDNNDLQNIVLSKINITRFKICESCLNMSDPANDYRVVKQIVNSYLNFSEAKGLFSEASDILDDIKKYQL